MVYALLGDSVPLQTLTTTVIDSPASSITSSVSDLTPRYELELELIDFCKKTPLSYAKELGFQELTMVLTNAIKKQNQT
jgi:hypothetical protein